MRTLTSNVLLFALCVLSACVCLKFVNEGAADTLQVVLFGSTAEICRNTLSRRLGWDLDVFAIVAAAAPLDYLLHKGSPSWRLFGVGPCDKRRHKRTRYGDCAPLQAHACYRYGSSEKSDLGMMLACHEGLQVSAGDAQRHIKQCHSDADLSWKGFESCITTSTTSHESAEKCLDLPLALLNCVRRYGVEEQFLRVTEKMESIHVHVEENPNNGTDDVSPAYEKMQCYV